MGKTTLAQLQTLLDVPQEQWPERGVRLLAGSINSAGRVNSGILTDGRYFVRVYNGDFTISWFEWGEHRSSM